MELNRDMAEKIIALLEAVILRPYMYVGGCGQSGNAASIWLAGFHDALCMLGVQTDHAKLYEEIVVAREWEWNAGAPDYEMKLRGMTEEERITERLAIEIEIWRRVLAQFPTGDQGT